MTFKAKLYNLFIARKYDERLAEITAPAREMAVELLQLDEGMTVVDLGCGSGLNQPYLVDAVGASGRVIGLDASSAMLSQAQQRANEQGYSNQITLIDADIRQLPGLRLQHEALNDVDALLATLIFSVVPDWQQVFSGAFALLRSGGRCAIMDTYWEDITLRERLLNMTFAADPARKSYALLDEQVDDFEISDYPPEGRGFFLAAGTHQ